MTHAAYVANISRGGQPSEGVTVATRKAKITNPIVGKNPVRIATSDSQPTWGCATS
jgi:hypothetical protein